MENFVIVTKKKEKNKIVWLHNKDIEHTLACSLCTKRVTWLCGAVGCGKTTLLTKILNTVKYTELNIENLKSKIFIKNFLKKVTLDTWVVVDGAYKDIIKSNTIQDIYTTYKHKFVFVADYEYISDPRVNVVTMKAPSKTKMINYGTRLIGRENSEKIYKKFAKNFRNFLYAIECFHKHGLEASMKDEFFDSNSNVKDLICKGGRGYQRFIGAGIEEHGHLVDVLFTNCAPKTMDDAVRISDAFSVADTYDTHIYNGNWEFLPYLTLQGCVIPSKINKNTIKPEDITPGTVWTKYYNHCMRKKLLAEFSRRAANIYMGHDFLIHIHNILMQSSVEECLTLLREYNIKSQDLDLMNHVVSTKLKGRKLIYLKKALKNG